MIITSRSNPIVKRYASLKEKKFREREKLFLVEGVKMVKEVLLSPYEVECVIYSSDYTGERYSSPYIEVSPSVFSYIADEKTPQGIIAAVKKPFETLKKPLSSCLVLENLQDPGNVGTIIRTANAAGYKDIYLINCADSYSPKCVRSAMSGLFFVRLYDGTEEEVFSALGDIGIIAADMEGKNIFDFTPPAIFALAIGNEGNGLSESVFKRAEHTVKIPMDKNAESLNAGVSAGIAMYVLKADKFKKN